MMRAAVLLLVMAATAAAAQDAPRTTLRVCADPDNLPYSHEDGSGFENRIARLVADDLGLPLEYAWLPDRRGFVRKTMGSGLCDLIVGVPVQFERT
ncbi:MAG TPA: quinoprotein dehydrogenase-associated putative ABC transporter substrate-binding protein, partial [Ramlibacter sp.]|nr:quinoprotein dehydrogenase-associated putative ABC transporter substrate-binding protein [Ramlibacter sp.]